MIITKFFCRNVLSLFGFMLLLAVNIVAQEATILTHQVQQVTASQNAASISPKQEALKINPVLGIGSVSEDNYRPLTGKQRWELFVREDFISPGAYLRAMGPAIGDHLAHHPGEWNLGVKGYGRRVASRYGTFLVQGAIRASTAALLKQDPRYIRSAQKSKLSRIGHAVLFNFVTLNNDGKKTLAIARIGSAYAGGVISMAWHPDRYSWKDGVRIGHQQLVFGNLSNLVQEFWPEIQGLFKKR